jgi:hypothetical protein
MSRLLRTNNAAHDEPATRFAVVGAWFVHRLQSRPTFGEVSGAAERRRDGLMCRCDGRRWRSMVRRGVLTFCWHWVVGRNGGAAVRPNRRVA